MIFLKMAILFFILSFCWVTAGLTDIVDTSNDRNTRILGILVILAILSTGLGLISLIGFMGSF